MWVRCKYPLADDQSLQRSMLAYMSDHNFVRTATLPYRHLLGKKQFQIASLNHSMWIHRHVNLNEWLLFDIHSSVAAGQRGLVMGHMFAQSGELVATLVQEGLVRLIEVSGGSQSFSENT